MRCQGILPSCLTQAYTRQPRPGHLWKGSSANRKSTHCIACSPARSPRRPSARTMKRASGPREAKEIARDHISEPMRSSPHASLTTRARFSAPSSHATALRRAAWPRGRHAGLGEERGPRASERADSADACRLEAGAGAEVMVDSKISIFGVFEILCQICGGRAWVHHATRISSSSCSSPAQLPVQVPE